MFLFQYVQRTILLKKNLKGGKAEAKGENRTYHQGGLNFRDHFLSIIALPKPDDGEGLASVAFGPRLHWLRGGLGSVPARMCCA